jgi:hypothetical protein
MTGAPRITLAANFADFAKSGITAVELFTNTNNLNK